MSMISFLFIGTVTIDLIIFAIVEKLSIKEEQTCSIEKWIVLISSYALIAFADYRFLVIMLVITVSTWWCARTEKLRVVGIIIPIIVLCFFKYYNFFAGSFASLFGNDFSALNLILPVGISFYSFSAISYIVDVGRKRIQPAGIIDVAVFIAFFPKLTSGPIQRFQDFNDQLNISKKVSLMNISEGIQIFTFGMFKKLVIADHLSVFVNQVFATPKAFGSATIILAILAYSLQIYFDFSGYSDMAIGSARIIGIKLPRNFNLPYLAQNVTEFWKRWHITLSSWLQDYLYISLGGNRKGEVRAYINLLLTMLIGGLWHGANWTFVIWGGLNGAALIVHKLWMKFTDSSNRKNSTIGRFLSTIGTFCFVSFCFIFFRADSLTSAIEIINRICSCERGLEQPYLWFFFAAVVLILASIIAARNSSRKGLKMERDSRVKKTNNCYVEGFYPIQNLNSIWGLIVFFTFVGLTLSLAYTGGSPFIYGKF